MRWKTTKPPLPKHNDTRITYPYAWKRTKIRDYIVWLEKYQKVERFYQPASGTPGWWHICELNLLKWYC